MISIWIIGVISPEHFQGAPRIASSSAVCKFLLHLSRYLIALNPIFTAYTLSPTFPNFLSSLQQMEPSPSQVRNHASEENQEAHPERALVFKKASILHCQSNVCPPVICLRASYCGWLISPISLINQEGDSNQEIGDDETEDATESTLSSDIEEDDLEHRQEELWQGQACRDKSLRTTRVPLPMIRSHADNVIACPLLPNSRNPPATMAPQLLKCQTSTLLNKVSECDCAPSARALVLPHKSSGDQHAAQPKASSDQNIPQYQKATFEVAKMFMEAIVFTKNLWPIISDEKYSMVEEAWKLAIEAQDHQWALAGSPVAAPSVCQLLGGPSFKIDPQTRKAGSLEFCLILLYQTYGYWLCPKIYILENED